MFDLVQNSSIIQLMDRAMSLASRRQALVASNLANLDTPGYRTRDFSFEGALQAALAAGTGQKSPSSLTKTHPRHLQGTTTFSLPPSTDPLRPNHERNDGNDVSLDRENMLLFRTQGTYQMASSFLQTELRKFFLITREGSR